MVVTILTTVFVLLYSVLEAAATTKTGVFIRQPRCPDKVVSAANCPAQVTADSVGECATKCLQRPGCVDFVLDKDGNVCQLCEDTVNSACTNTRPAGSLQEFQLDTCSINGVKRTDSGNSGECPHAYQGSDCKQRVRDCHDLMQTGNGDGVYWVRPSLDSPAFQVYCTLTWNRTTIMKRVDGNVDFYRNWQEYRDGFGDLSGSHWLGLNKIRLLTSIPKYCMMAQFVLKNNTIYFIRYFGFTVSNESSNFAMDYSFPYTYDPGLGDCLDASRMKGFSTYDSDNDQDPGINCAEKHRSGWWFGGGGGGSCAECNPNGMLNQPADMQRLGTPEEVFWTPGLGNLVPKFVELSLKKCIL